MSTAGRRLAAGLGLLLLIGLAWSLRVVDAPTIFTEAGVRAAGPDAYYHLRRAAFSVAHFPAVLERDAYLNHPQGGDVIWPPGLAWSTAGLVRVALGDAPERAAFERFALTIPPVLGVLAVLWAGVFAARRFGLGAGFVAAGLLAVLPGHALYTRLGMLDHHALESIFTLAFLSAAGGLWRASEAGRGLAWATSVLAATAALAFLFWPGLVLQLALVDGVLVAAVFLGAAATWRRRLAWGAAGAHGMAALALLPWADREWSYWGSFAPVVLGAFQPWLLACAALVFATAGLRSHAAPAPRMLSGVGLGMVLLVGSALAFPALLEVPERAWGWLGRADAFQAQVSESLPLFAAGPQGRLGVASRLLSFLCFASPLVWVFYARSLRGEARQGSAEGILLAVMALGLGAAAVAQRRFVNAFSVPEALLFGWALGAAIPAWVRARGLRTAPRAVAVAVISAVVLLALTPITAIYGPALERRVAAANGKPLRLAADVRRRHELHVLADWIREATPPTGGFFDPGVAPEYGVLAHWSNGHILEYVARRPTVVTNFGDDLGEENWLLAARYFAAGEREASRLLDASRVRYVLLEWRPQPPLDEFGPGSMIARGFFADGEAGETSTLGTGRDRRTVAGDQAAFERHRLVQEASPKPWMPEQPFFKVYEHVAGARVEGRAPAGADVVFELDLATPRGRHFTWRSIAEADTTGRYAARLPYATRGAPDGVRPAAAYRVRASGREASLVVDEVAVQEGRVVAGPELLEATQ
ncbi:MAG: hypothetical protein JRH10_11950 [Deltaproteobacteria bacterium]|nr:hypothetical protein [Deltaproteobacteria bacterium]MBW2447058.1 hypothetical protein [Deltaproteobacteria bacterium]